MAYPYKNSLLYEAHHAPYREDLPYWLALARRFPAPALELGCGSGRVLLYLAQSGIPVWGLDRDAEMLARLQEYLSGWENIAPYLIQADMGDFHLAQKFGLIYSPCNTFSTLTRQQRQHALHTIHFHLREGGCFAASLPDPATLRECEPSPESEPESNFIHPTTGNPVQVSSAYWREGSVFLLQWIYDHLYPDGEVKRQVVTVSHEINSLEDYVSELEEAGFVVQQLWADFKGTPYTDFSPQLVWEAVKSSG
jgi:SAM-dependent methyltransferase